jgi:hypothetical protein
MFDVCAVFTTLEKGLQKSTLILPDVIALTDGALRKLELMKNNPFPGGMEEKYAFTDTSRRIKFNKFVTTSRNPTAIRFEILSAAVNFLQQRLNIEHDPTLESIRCICIAKSCNELINGSQPLLKAVTVCSEVLAQYAAEVCEQWTATVSVPSLEETTEIGTQYSIKLCHLLRITSGLVRQVLSSVFVTCPHSMS